ncbi:MAG: LamG domain-containing protein [Rudanella sp.]|nr:LamG domain-containing protein [Rudanella sp.]
MRLVLIGMQRLKLYTILLFLGLLVCCQSWNFPFINGSLTEGLIACYSFEGNTLDASGNNLTGQLINGATYGTNREGTAQSALQLDGIDDYFEIPDDAKLRPDSISISLWLKAKQVVTATDGTRHIYNKDTYATHDNQQYSAFMGRPRSSNIGSATACCEFFVDVNNDGACTVEQPVKNELNYYVPTFELNKWYHFVTIYSGQTLRLYINGELKVSQKEQTLNPIDRCIGGNLRFGAQAAYDTNCFDGIMDEIRIYNRGLTQAEITALYKQ